MNLIYLEKMMIETLEELNTTKGVRGALIANMKGHIVVSNTNELETTIPLEKMTEDIKKFLADNKLMETEPKWLQFNYDNIIIFIQIIKNAYIIVFCETDIVPALLRLTLNVTCTKIKNNKSIIKKIATA